MDLEIGSKEQWYAEKEPIEEEGEERKARAARSSAISTEVFSEICRGDQATISCYLSIAGMKLASPSPLAHCGSFASSAEPFYLRLYTFVDVSLFLSQSISQSLPLYF